jgi:hypothetical protein
MTMNPSWYGYSDQHHSVTGSHMPLARDDDLMDIGFTEDHIRFLR